MKQSSVVLLQSDARVTQSLIHSFANRTYSLHSARSLDELRNSIIREHADVVVLDMEMAPISEVENLSHRFPKMRIICTHRLADEKMWTTALGAGAADVVPSSDTRSILAAVTGTPLSHTAAA